MSQTASAPVDRSSTVYLARRYRRLLDDLKDEFVGRDEAIDVIALATLCREHVLLIGPPGTAKTALLRRFAQMFDDTMLFTYLLTRFTEPTELFGPVDVQKFQEGVFRVRTANMLPKVRLAFLDEVFEGSSAILNALLTLINERIFYNGSEPEPSPLITLLGSSNAIPDDPVLAAFGDRFLLRSDLDYVDDTAIRDVLITGWDAEKDFMRRTAHPGPAADVEHFSLADLERLQDAVIRVDLEPIRGLYTEILRELRIQRVAFSDRRAVKAQKVFAAAAVMDGRTEATSDDLAPLANLWAERRDQDTIRRALEGHEVKLARRTTRVRDLSELMQGELPNLVNIRENARGPADLQDAAEGLRALMRELRQDHPEAKGELKAVDEERKATLRAIEERSGRV